MNLLGMFLGSLVVKYFEMTEYNWARLRVEQLSHAVTTPRSRRIAKQFFPLEWTTVSWDVLGSSRRFFGTWTPL
jgi:hypothetical protein